MFEAGIDIKNCLVPLRLLVLFHNSVICNTMSEPWAPILGAAWAGGLQYKADMCRIV